MLLAIALRGRSILTKVTLTIGGMGVFCLFTELFVDRWLTGAWSPAWSLVVLAVCAAIIVPLVIIRRTPSLREEVRRRFHM